jgi:hypothetical protein
MYREVDVDVSLSSPSCEDSFKLEVSLRFLIEANTDLSVRRYLS